MSDAEFEQMSKEVGVASREEAYYYKMMVERREDSMFR